MSLSVNQNTNSNPYIANSGILNTMRKNPADVLESNNMVVNAYEYKENPMVILGMTIPVWLGISHIMQKFNRLCSTTLKDGKQTSILHKVQDFGDNLGKKLDSSPFIQKISKSNSKIKTFLQDKIISKNKFLNSIVNTPAEPEFGMAKMMSKGTIAETAQDATEAIQAYCKSIGKEPKDVFKNFNIDEIIKNPYKNVKEIKEILKQIPDTPIEVCKFKPAIVKKVLSRKVYPSELINKMNILSGISLKDESKQLTNLGKTLPKGFLRTVEGLTNGTAGGKLAILMQAYCIADALLRTLQAPKGEKVETFTECLTNDLSYYLMMPLGLGFMYHLCGAKYLGMDIKDVEKYRNDLKALNDKVASGTCTKEYYEQAKAALKEQLKGSTKLSLKKDGAAKTALKAITNIVNVPVKFIGKFLSVGLEKAAPYTNSSNGSIFKFFKTIPNYLKSGFGGFLRFVLYLFVIAPPLAKAATKVSHFIFGKPTYSILDDKEDVDVTPEQVKNTITIQIPNRTFDDENPKFNNSLNKPAFAGKITFENKDIKETELTYVPSSKGVNVIPKDPIKARIAIQNSLETEKFVNKRIKEKFKREY